MPRDGILKSAVMLTVLSRDNSPYNAFMENEPMSSAKNVFFLLMGKYGINGRENLLLLRFHFYGIMFSVMVISQ